MKKSLLILPMTAALLFAGLVVAEPEHTNNGKQSTGKILKRLDLTEQQKSDIRSFRQQGKQDRLIFKQDMSEINEQLQSIIRASQWDEQAAKLLLSQKQTIRTKLALARATAKNTMWTSLTEQQKDKLSAQPKHQHKKAKHRNAMRRFGPLDLSDSQRQTIATIVNQQKIDTADLVARKNEFKQQQVQLIRSKDFDDDAWLQLDAQQRELDLSLGLAMAYRRHQIWNQLDEVQQAKMVKMTEKRKEKMKRRAKDRM